MLQHTGTGRVQAPRYCGVDCHKFHSSNRVMNSNAGGVSFASNGRCPGAGSPERLAFEGCTSPSFTQGGQSPGLSIRAIWGDALAYLVAEGCCHYVGGCWPMHCAISGRHG
jgi:hypothetical protein